MPEVPPVELLELLLELLLLLEVVEPLEELLELEELLLELEELLEPVPLQDPRLVHEASLPGTVLVYQLARYRVF